MLRRNMTSAECQISDPKGRYLVFTLLFFQMPMMKTQGLNTKIITKKPKSARNCESRANVHVAFKSPDCQLLGSYPETGFESSKTSGVLLHRLTSSRDSFLGFV